MQIIDKAFIRKERVIRANNHFDNHVYDPYSEYEADKLVYVHYYDDSFDEYEYTFNNVCVYHYDYLSSQQTLRFKNIIVK